MGINFLKINPDRVMLDGLEGVPKHFAQMNVDTAVQAQKAEKIGNRYEALLKECGEAQSMMIAETTKYVSMVSTVNAFAKFLSQTQRDIIAQRLADSCDPETSTESTDGAPVPDDKGENTTLDQRRAVADEIGAFVREMIERKAPRGEVVTMHLHDEISDRVMEEAAKRITR